MRLTPTTRLAPQERCDLPELRVYAFRDLAVLYYPRVRPDLASRKLRRLIKYDPLIANGLRRRGFRPGKRQLSPVHIDYLVEHLGSPSDFADIEG